MGVTFASFCGMVLAVGGHLCLISTAKEKSGGSEENGILSLFHLGKLASAIQYMCRACECFNVSYYKT